MALARQGTNLLCSRQRTRDSNPEASTCPGGPMSLRGANFLDSSRWVSRTGYCVLGAAEDQVRSFLTERGSIK